MGANPTWAVTPLKAPVRTGLPFPRSERRDRPFTDAIRCLQGEYTKGLNQCGP